MCSNPQTFINKDTGEAKVGACRRCDECIATRRHGWVARAMAEKAEWPHCLVIHLTYSDDTERSRDGAHMFAYADVRDFMKRLASACRRRDCKAKVRFLCAGEQGDRNGRCHWHLIVYSTLDLLRIGTFRRSGVLVEHRDKKISRGKHKIRLNWSLWPHGFMLAQEPDQGGMNYVLSYCLKDQFNLENSADTMRHAKAENFATGLFRMSKRPAIGERWLYRKLEGLERLGAVLPTTNLKVPGFRGYWHPNGTMREKLLWGLVALNQRVRWATGADAPQWPSLLQSCEQSENDMEVLLGQPDPQADEDYRSFEFELTLDQSQTAGSARQGEFRRTCGSRLPCQDCLHKLDDAQLAALNVWRNAPQDGSAWEYYPIEGAEPVSTRQARPGNGLNPYCLKRGTKEAGLAFPRTGARASNGRAT